MPNENEAIEELTKDIPTEGDPVNIPQETPEEKETPADSPTEKETDKTPAPQGEETAVEDKPKPFHLEPRFKALVQEKNDLREEVDKLKEQVSEPIKTSEGDSQAPTAQWSRLYGDDKDTWENYQQLSSQEKQEWKDEIKEEWRQEQTQQQEKADADVRQVDVELQNLKDEGKKFDQNELLKTAEDYPIMDSQGNRDWQKTYQMHELMQESKKDPVKDANRKQVAADTASTPAGEPVVDSAPSMEEIREGLTREGFEKKYL